MTGLVASILGCGPSPGVPRIGNDWGSCDPGEPRNLRSRCSLLIERRTEGRAPTRILVDTSPDMRTQLLTAGVDHLDGVLYTHAHADHLHGIDDLRAFWMKTKRRLDVYADDVTAERILAGFGYCFRTPPGGSYPPILTMNRIAADTPFSIAGDSGPIEVTPFAQSHGPAGESLGFRFGALAYSCDVSALDDQAVSTLQGLEVWIVDALRREPHPSHFSVREALAWIERLKPRRAILTHMDYSLDYAELKSELPPNVEPAYDGMVIAL
jgi:phosphoribosyl 1,2-cyclic phosphate phosphodiesterase